MPSPLIARSLVGLALGLIVLATTALRPRSTGPGMGADCGLTSHLLIISIDGLRPDAIERYSARTMIRLLDDGAHTLEATTIYPSRTLPSHTSMLTGVPPEDHGVDWNSERTGKPGVIDRVTVFEAAHSAGLETMAFFSKSKLGYLRKPGTLDHSELPRGSRGIMATETVEAAVRYLKHRRPNLIFVHIAEPDYAGHIFGWMGRVYGWAVRRADAGVERLLREADRTFGPDGYTVIITADHGGHRRGHGTDDPRDMMIPWITWGRGVEGGELNGEVIRTMDTAATALWLLGVEIPADWKGRPVRSAYLHPRCDLPTSGPGSP